MSIEILTTEAMEEGSFFVTVAFLDEDSAAVTPNEGTIYWTLTDNDGTVINDRDYVAEASASSVTIELTGDDLAVQTGETAALLRRKITILWEYDSDLGNDKPAKSEVIFLVRNLTRIPVDI